MAITLAVTRLFFTCAVGGLAGSDSNDTLVVLTLRPDGSIHFRRKLVYLRRMPFWIVCSIYAGIHSGMPGSGQIFQSFLVALFSGVAATLLFFKATDMVKHNPTKLAVIEATQSGEVVFIILLGVIFLHDSFPDTLSLIGIIMIILGMIANSLATKN